MALADEIRNRREARRLTLDELAVKSGISKTYIWELESDTAEAKKPSADVLMKLAAALGTTIAELLERQTVKVKRRVVEIPASLVAFRAQAKSHGIDVTDDDLRDLAVTRFRGVQPTKFTEWLDLYLVMKRISEG